MSKNLFVEFIKAKKFWVKLINTKIKEVTAEKTTSDIEKKRKR